MKFKRTELVANKRQAGTIQELCIIFPMAGPYNVPDVPGVPVLNYVPGAELGIELLDSDGLLPYLSLGPQWGIFLDGAPVVTADSVIDFSLKKEWALSDAPQEEGVFETYDKVFIPFDVRIRFSAGGSLANRQALLDSIDAIAGDYNLYDAVTPESTYSSCNVTHYDYRRTSRNGVGLIVVDVWLFQVMVVGSTDFGDNTQAASGADPTNGGTVQGTDPSSAQDNAVTGSGVGVDSATPDTAAPAPATSGAGVGGASGDSITLPEVQISK